MPRRPLISFFSQYVQLQSGHPLVTRATRAFTTTVQHSAGWHSGSVACSLSRPRPGCQSVTAEYGTTGWLRMEISQFPILDSTKYYFPNTALTDGNCTDLAPQVPWVYAVCCGSMGLCR